MLANRQDAQPALANVDHGLLSGLAPCLLPRVGRSEGRDFLIHPARSLRCFRPRVLFIFLIPQPCNTGEIQLVGLLTLKNIGTEDSQEFTKMLGSIQRRKKA